MREDEIKNSIRNGFSLVKDDFYKEFKIEEREQDNVPFVLSLRDVIESLPPAIQAIEIIDTEKNRHGLLIKYDYSRLRSDQIIYYGIKKLDELLSSIIEEKFEIEKKDIEMCTESIYNDFTTTSIWEPDKDWHLHFFEGDIVKEPEVFYQEWKRFLIFQRNVPILSEKFRRERFEDYNKIYKIKPVPILSLEELCSPGPQSSMFSFGINDLQEKISNIQLIPKVPKDIQTVFRRAKDLFLFGYFKYDFFTISEHYAFLALEAALKTRYVMYFGKEILLTDSKKPKLSHKITNATFHTIEDFAMRIPEWNKYTLLVNGEEFPYNKEMLLTWFDKKHLIRKWEKENYLIGLKLRNSFSHQERPSVLIPNANMLYVIANQINYLFH